jgi:hypothetical protein
MPSDVRNGVIAAFRITGVPPTPISGSKLSTFTGIREGCGCKFLLLLKLLADSRHQRSCGRFSGTPEAHIPHFGIAGDLI